MGLRIAISTNAPWTPSGYGVQAAELVPQLVKAGHEVKILANYGLAGAVFQWGNPPVDVYPQGVDAYSNDLHPAQMARIIGDQRHRGLGMTLFDVWVYKNPEWDQIPLLSWVPVDHYPAPQEVVGFFNRPGQKWAVAMSRFGETTLLEQGISRDRVFYAPHSLNPEIYRPDGENLRGTLNVPKDAHLTMINAANKGATPPRKAWAEQILAWSIFANQPGHEDAYLYLHTDISGIAQGINLQRLLKATNAPTDRVRIVPQYEYRMGIDALTVAKLYRSADVLLHATYGEGFGVCIIESQGCGTPVVVTDHTAMPELLGAGWKVGGQLSYDHFQPDGWWKVPSIDAIVDALRQSYALKGSDQYPIVRAQAAKFAEQFHTEKVFADHWATILSRVEREVGKPRPSGVNREERRKALRKGKK